MNHTLMALNDNELENLVDYSENDLAKEVARRWKDCELNGDEIEAEAYTRGECETRRYVEEIFKNSTNSELAERLEKWLNGESHGH